MKKTLVIGSDGDLCSLIKNHLESLGMITTVVLNYKEGIDRLFYEEPDLSVLEVISRELSPALIGKINGSERFRAVEVKKSIEVKEGWKPVLILEQRDQINLLFDYLRSYPVSDDSSPLDRPKEADDLESFSYPALLASLYHNKQSGVLEVDSRVKLKIYFIKGIPIFAEGGDVETALGRILLDSRRLKETDYEKAIDTATKNGQRFGEVLVGMGLISPHELNDFLEFQVKEKIIRGCAYTQGSYSFKPDESFKGRFVKYQIKFPQLLYEGIKRFVDSTLIEDSLSIREHNPIIKIRPGLKEKITGIGIGPKELRFLQQLKDKSGLNDVLQASKVQRDEAVKLVYFLYLMGFFDIENASPARVKKKPDVVVETAKKEETKPHIDEIIVLEEEVGEFEPEDLEKEAGKEVSVMLEDGHHDNGKNLYEKSGKELEIELAHFPDQTKVDFQINPDENSVFEHVDMNVPDRTVIEADRNVKETAPRLRLERNWDEPAEETVIHSETRKDIGIDQNTLQKEADNGGLHHGIILAGEQQASKADTKELSIETFSRQDNDNKARADLSVKDAKIDEEDKKKKFDSHIQEIIDLASSLRGKSYYEVLRVGKKASKEEIKDAYFSLVKKFHPDANPNLRGDIKNKAEEIFTAISNAYENLYDDLKRYDYDSQNELATLKKQAKSIYEGEFAYKEGEALVKQRRYLEAEGKFREAVNLNPEESAYIGALAWATFLAAPDKDIVIEEAKKQVEKAIAMNPNVAENYYYLGYIYKHINDIRKAGSNFLKAVELNPELLEAKREIRLIEQRRIEKNMDKKMEKRFWSSLFKK